MKLSRHQPDPETNRDMTPMIGVVLLCVLGFMLITSLLGRAPEESGLQVATGPVTDEVQPGEWRPILNIPFDGQIGAQNIKEWLSIVAEQMNEEHFNNEAQTGPLPPDDFLIPRPDQGAPFRHIEKLKAFCAANGVDIWPAPPQPATTQED